MDYPKVREQLELLAISWESECIHSGLPTGGVSIADDRRWRFPPLMAKSRSEAVSLNNLLRDFYYQPSGDQEVIDAWDNAVAALLNRRRGYPLGILNREFSGVFPDVTFGADIHHPYIHMVQFLQCAAWHKGRSLEIGKDRAILNMGKLRLGIDRTGLFNSKGGTRVRMELNDMRMPLQCLRGRAGKQPKYVETNAAYRHLIRTLPHRSSEIDIAFCVGIRSGPEIEKILHERFNVRVDEAAPNDNDDAIDAAREIIETSYSNPIRQLANVLIPRFGAKEFTAAFGNPYQRAAKTYTATMQQRHRAALEALVDGKTNKEVIKRKSGSDKLLSHLFGI